MTEIIIPNVKPDQIIFNDGQTSKDGSLMFNWFMSLQERATEVDRFLQNPVVIGFGGELAFNALLASDQEGINAISIDRRLDLLTHGTTSEDVNRLPIFQQFKSIALFTLLFELADRNVRSLHIRRDNQGSMPSERVEILFNNVLNQPEQYMVKKPLSSFAMETLVINALEIGGHQQLLDRLNKLKDKNPDIEDQILYTLTAPIPVYRAIARLIAEGSVKL